MEKEEFVVGYSIIAVAAWPVITKRGRRRDLAGETSSRNYVTARGGASKAMPFNRQQQIEQLIIPTKMMHPQK